MATVAFLCEPLVGLHRARCSITAVLLHLMKRVHALPVPMWCSFPCAQPILSTNAFNDSYPASAQYSPRLTLDKLRGYEMIIARASLATASESACDAGRALYDFHL